MSLLILMFFVYIILCSVFYLIISRKKDKKYRREVKKLKRTFGMEILNQLEMIKNKQEIPYDDILKINKKLKEKIYEQVFSETIITFNKSRANRRYTKIYMSKFTKYINSIVSKKKIKEQKAYIAFLLGEYKVETESVNEFLYECINSDSLHLRFNGLRSISKIGNVDYFIKALNIVSDNKENLNSKIMIDAIDDFGGDIDKLYNEIVGDFHKFTDKSKCLFIAHLADKKNGILSEKLLSMLKANDTDYEVKSSIIKYFGVIKYNDSKEELLKILDGESWEYRALSVRALDNYEGEDIVDKLMETIKDENWYVRFNSATTLLKLNISDSKLMSILTGEDKYASEIMEYAISFNNNKNRK